MGDIRLAPISLALALALTAPTAAAQRVPGRVVDGQTGAGLPGAVLTQVDADGATLARTLSSTDGRFLLAIDSAARTVRVVRLGYATRELPAREIGAAPIIMQRIPQALRPLRVEAEGCEGRSTDAAAVALLDQARAGLLAAVVSRDGDPVSVVRLRFERRLERSGAYDAQRVWVDSAMGTHRTFATAPSGAELAARGFLEQRDEGLYLHAPDADVFLDDAFIASYCFRVARRDRARPRDVGLAFAPSRAARDRVDVEGTVWVDTAARELREIAFTYVGLPRSIRALDPGGEVTFLALSNGLVLVDRWRLRLIGITYDTIPSIDTGGDTTLVVRDRMHVSESGGEVAAVRWPGNAYEGALGALSLAVQMPDSQPAVGARFWLDGTDYQAVTDSTGRARIDRLLPGPYTLLAYDPTTVSIDLPIPAGVRFDARRDSLHTASIVLPTAERYMQERCGVRQRVRTDTVPWILGRIRRANGELIEPGIVRAKKEVRNGTWEPVRELFRVGTDGLFWICSRELAHEKEVILEYQIRGGRRHELRIELTRRDLTVVPFDIEP